MPSMMMMMMILMLVVSTASPDAVGSMFSIGMQYRRCFSLLFLRGRKLDGNESAQIVGRKIREQYAKKSSRTNSCFICVQANRDQLKQHIISLH
ncbi:hypothetical protein CRM22_008290 [Opisthorchis felineus]|uniref:C2H2-type domain-containing protein n=1 Tax=Opisthorchis felineus TaxID=147828 RepID=A0A4S2LCD7_OPIFE|nr:hypothetical protein CRM22_008290 [Opisthorchis felineus]